MLLIDHVVFMLLIMAKLKMSVLKIWESFLKSSEESFLNN